MYGCFLVDLQKITIIKFGGIYLSIKKYKVSFVATPCIKMARGSCYIYTLPSLLAFQGNISLNITVASVRKHVRIYNYCKCVKSCFIDQID